MPYVFRTRGRQGRLHRFWRFQYTDAAGRRRTGTGYPTKPETEALAAHVQAEHNSIRKGYVPAPKSAAKHAARLFADVTAEYCQWGESQGGRDGRPWARRHADLRRRMLDWWGKRLGLVSLADLAGVLPRVEEALRELQEVGRERKPDDKRQRKPVSGKTLGDYADALHSFCGWCVRLGYLEEDPLQGLAAFNKQPVRARRALTVEEVRKLLDKAPERRRLLYEVALCSGLRAGELRGLRVADLDTEHNRLVLRPETTKNRKGGHQPLHPALVARLAEQATGLAGDAPLLHVPTHTERVIGRDLAAAGVKRAGPGGVLDFHSLRTTFVNLVTDAGASVHEAQRLARHSTPNLTMNVYGRPRTDRMAEVAERVGAAVLGPEVKAASITGAQRLVAGGESYCPDSSYGGVSSVSSPAALTTGPQTGPPGRG